MFPLLQRFFFDIDTFQSWGRIAWVAVKTFLLAVPVGMTTGAITWPAWMPPQVLMGMTVLSAIIQFGEKNVPPKTNG